VEGDVPVEDVCHFGVLFGVGGPHLLQEVLVLSQVGGPDLILLLAFLEFLDFAFEVCIRESVLLMVSSFSA
jgi:hypothetical protein